MPVGTFYTISTSRGKRRYRLIWSRQRSRFPKAQTHRSLVTKTQKAHCRHRPWSTSLLPHLVETRISLPQGTDSWHLKKRQKQTTRTGRRERRHFFILWRQRSLLLQDTDPSIYEPNKSGRGKLRVDDCTCGMEFSVNNSMKIDDRSEHRVCMPAMLD